MSKLTPPTKATRRQKRKADKDAIAPKPSPKKRHVPSSKQLATKPKATESNHPRRDRAVLRSSTTKRNAIGDADLMSAEEMKQLEELSAKASRSRGLQSKAPAKSRISEVSNPRSLPPMRSQRNYADNNVKDDDDDKEAEEEEEKEEEEEEEKEEEEEEEENNGNDGDDEQVGYDGRGHGDSDDEQEVSINFNNRSDEQRSIDNTVTAIGTKTPQIRPVNPTQIQQHVRANANLATINSGSTDDSVLINIVNVMKASILKHIDMSLNRITSEMAKDRTILTKLREDVSELESMLNVIATSLFIKQTSANPRLKEIQKKLCLLPALFNEQYLLTVLSKCLIGFGNNCICKGSDLEALVGTGIDLISVMYFCRKPNEKAKEKFDSIQGKLFSRFRHGFMLSAFMALQDNKFGTFRTKYDLDDDSQKDRLSTGTENTLNERSNSSKIIQPFWLVSRYVLTEHCRSAATKIEKTEKKSVLESQDSYYPEESESTEAQESSQASTISKLNRSGPITRDEVAIEAASMVYRLITQLFYKCRPVSKIQLFNDSLYLFAGWDQFDVSVKQTNLVMRWGKAISGDVDYFDNLQKTRTVRLQDKYIDLGSEGNQIDADNLRIIETLIHDHQELCLLVQHDVMVAGKCRLLTYRISLIEVVARLVSSFTSLETNSKTRDALKIDKSCLKPIVVLALGLRRLMEKAVEDVNRANSILWATNMTLKGRRGRPRRAIASSTGTQPASVLNYKFEVVNGMSLEQLQPSWSRQKDCLSVLLNMTEEEFQVRNDTPFAGRNGYDHNITMEESFHDDEGRIEADEINGVFSF